MKRTFLSAFVSVCLSAFAVLHDYLIEPLARTGDRFLTFGLNFLDDMVPFAAVAGVPGAVLRPSRDVTYLTRGLHRMAQPILMRAGDDPEDGHDPATIDNGLKIGAAASNRLNC